MLYFAAYLIGPTRELDATVMYTVAVAGGIEDNLTNSDGVVALAAVVAEQVNTDPQIGSSAPYLIYTLGIHDTA